jgi:transcriptional regulator with GAF, ATPase, and Fis domain
VGRVELADGGTLFLDEVGELPLEIQTTLLRVLQEKVFERLGGCTQIRTQVRLIAATNRDLQAAVAAGTFRSDLYYRLHVFPIEMPPLRSRREDIPLLTQQFIDSLAPTIGKKITQIDAATMAAFQSYHWPGNIRELRNVVEHSLILSEDGIFSADLACSAVRENRDSGTLLERLALYERTLIENALQQCRGKVSGENGAACRLGVPSTTLESKIKALDIDKKQFRS